MVGGVGVERSAGGTGERETGETRQPALLTVCTLPSSIPLNTSSSSCIVPIWLLRGRRFVLLLRQ
jgi:hypothetical protein